MLCLYTFTNRCQETGSTRRSEFRGNDSQLVRIEELRFARWHICITYEYNVEEHLNKILPFHSEMFGQTIFEVNLTMSSGS